MVALIVTGNGLINQVTDLICYLTSGNANIGMSAILIRWKQWVQFPLPPQYLLIN